MELGVGGGEGSLGDTADINLEMVDMKQRPSSCPTLTFLVGVNSIVAVGDPLFAAYLSALQTCKLFHLHCSSFTEC